ncbi:MAG: hypothetical protein AAGA77_15375 [Bacteroidota bacterium]
MKKHILSLILCFTTSLLCAQESTLSGKLEDNGNPILFATVAVYRNDILIRGTETDINGNYSILCQPGDRIEFSYIGYTSKSVIVTEAMLSSNSNSQKQKNQKMRSKTFRTKMMDRKHALTHQIKNNSNSSISLIQMKNRRHLYKNFSDFNLKNGTINFTLPKKPIRYNLTVSKTIGTQFVMPFHRHPLQNTYSQGRPIQGTLIHQTRAQKESHSFGPEINKTQNINAFDNNLLSAGTTFSTKINLQAERNNQKFYSILKLDRNPDIFNTFFDSSIDLKLGTMQFKNAHAQEKNWNLEFRANRLRLGNHNYTGTYQHVLRSMMIQSPSFNSSSGAENNIAFSPEFDHPAWLLSTNNNPVRRDAISLFADHNWKSNAHQVKLYNAILLEYQHMNIEENIVNNLESSSNVLNIKSPKSILTSHAEVNLTYALRVTLDNVFSAKSVTFNSFENETASNNRRDHILRNSGNLKLSYQHDLWSGSIGMNSMLANNQHDIAFNPNFSLNYKFNFRRKKVDILMPYIGATKMVKNLDILLDRYNYSSLQSNHYDLNDLRLDIPLWLPDNLENELKNTYTIGLKASKFYKRSKLSSKLEYNYIDQQNAIFPILENERWILQNAADFTTHHWSWFSSWKGTKRIFKRHINFENSFEVSHFTTNVNTLHTASNRIPIAGFKSVSKNLIEGQSVGIIYGSDFVRNENEDRLIGSDGFPVKSDQYHIIADPTPLLSFGYSQKINYGSFSLNVVLDGQIGGKIWNGTQQILDYYGVSKQSARDRTVSNFVFEGVLADGSENTIEVALAEPYDGLDGNIWNRYGAEGIASDYIRDASHLNLKSIEFSYLSDVMDKSSLECTLYAKNILTIASFRGFSTTPLFEDSISYGLQYFNQPISSEIGLSLTYKL